MAKKTEHYVNNAEFSKAVAEYVEKVNIAREAGESIPVVPNYIAQCFINIAEGLSRKSHFIRYTYREEMVLDGIENCLKAIENYNLETATRSGKPNAFSYFTTIVWYAFLRRIAKEKKQQDTKIKYMTSQGFESYATFNSVSGSSSMSYVSPAEMSSVVNYVDNLRGRIDQLHDWDASINEFVKAEKQGEKARTIRLADSNSEEHDD